jgi:hypothetical protein
MNALVLLQQNPHAAQVIKEYYVKLMLDTLDESLLPENFKDFLREQGIDDEKVAQMMEANARNVYDVLDENGFVISMTYDVEFKKFSWYVNDDQHKIVCDTRKQAENEAVAACMFRLERKLNPEPDEEN